jgi:hypothetical protein
MRPGGRARRGSAALTARSGRDRYGGHQEHARAHHSGQSLSMTIDRGERQRGVVLIAALVAVAALLSWAVLGTSSKQQFSAAEVGAARTLCVRYGAKHGLTAPLISSGPATAGAVTTLSRQMGVNTAPWSALPDDHVVALCDFQVPSNPEINATAPSTRCPNGQVFVLPELPAPHNVIVDAQGRSSQNYAADASLERAAHQGPC